jgi:hypothetical protein
MANSDVCAPRTHYHSPDAPAASVPKKYDLLLVSASRWGHRIKNQRHIPLSGFQKLEGRKDTSMRKCRKYLSLPPCYHLWLAMDVTEACQCHRFDGRIREDAAPEVSFPPRCKHSVPFEQIPDKQSLVSQHGVIGRQAHPQPTRVERQACASYLGCPFVIQHARTKKSVCSS